MSSIVTWVLIRHTVNTHGNTMSQAYTFRVHDGDQHIELTGPYLAILSWICAIAAKYTFVNGREDFIDPRKYLGMLGFRVEGGGGGS